MKYSYLDKLLDSIVEDIIDKSLKQSLLKLFLVIECKKFNNINNIINSRKLLQFILHESLTLIFIKKEFAM